MWKESEHPRDEKGRWTEKEQAGKLLGVNLSPINTKKTGMSYYDQLIPGHPENEYMSKSKNLKGEIVEMSPNEYYAACAKDIFGHGDVEKLKEQRRQDQDSSKLEEVLNKGESLDMPMINYANKGQEGLHRMMILGDKYGWDEKFPVLKVDYDDIEYEKSYRNNRIDRAMEYIKDDIEEERVYNKESFINQLKKRLNWDFKIEDKGTYCTISDDLVERKIDYPIFDDELDFEDLELDEDLFI